MTALNFGLLCNNGSFSLLNPSPTGFHIEMKSMAEKQLMLDKIIENNGLSAVKHILTQVKGLQRLKTHILNAFMVVVAGKPLCYAGYQSFR